jgi:hypothetical protein
MTMRRLTLAIGILALSAAPARGDQPILNNQDFRGHYAYGLGSPSGSPAPPTSPLLYGGHAAGSFPASTSGILSDISCSAADPIPQYNGTTWSCGPASGTTFGSVSPLSVFANATNAPAVPGFVAGSTVGTFLGVQAGPTLGFGAITPALAGTVATWSLAGVRVFAVSPAGSDSNQCWADSPDTTQANVEIATAAAGAKPCLTLAGAAAETPPALDNRQAYVIAKAGTYSDGLGVFNHAKGGTLRFRCTGTGSTASATAFTGDTNDLTYEGAVTTAGMNAAGYNPTSGGTGTILTLQLAGGGAPGFGAEPAAPLMRRLRFDSATTTVALRNAVFSIIEVPASNQVRIPTSITYASTDVAYIEDPGCVTSGFAIFNGSQFVSVSGWSVGFLSVSNGSYSTSFVNAATFGVSATNATSFSTSVNVAFLPTPTIGPSILGPLTVTGGVSAFGANSFLATGNSAALSTLKYFVSSSNVFSGPLFVDGGWAGSTQFGSNSGVAIGDGGGTSSPQTAVRFLSVLQMQGANVALGNANFPNNTDATAIQVQGECSLNLVGAVFGGTKTSGGIDISVAHHSRISWVSPSVDATKTPTIVGVNGAIYGGPSPQANGFPVYVSSWTTLSNISVLIGTNLLTPSTQADFVPVRAHPVINRTTSVIPDRSVVVEQWTDGNGVIPAFADTQAHLNGGIGVLLGDLPASTASVGGFAIYDGVTPAIQDAAPPNSHPVTSGGFAAYVSQLTPGTFTITRPTSGLVRQIGWTVAENHLQLTADNLLQPISQIYSAGTQQHTEPGLNFGSEFAYADNSGALRGDISINAISTAKVTGILPLGQVGPPSGTGFWHITAGASDSAARAVDLSGADVTNKLPLTALAQGGASTTNVLVWNGTAWAPAASAGGLGDPGANGIVVRTALNTTTARTITSSGATITITNANGVAGNPNVDVNLDGATLDQGVGGVVQVANGGVGTTQLASSAVTYAKIQNETAGTLLGNPGAGAAAPSEITLGAHCSFTGTVLDCSGGGGSGVTSVAVTDPVTVSASTGAVTIGTKFDNSTITLSVGGALQRGHVSGGGLDIPAGSNTAAISGLTISQITPPTGTGLWGITSGASDAAATAVSTGLTRSLGNLTVNLSTGVTGGQTVIGGTASTDDLTLTSTSNATKHRIILGSTAGVVFDEANTRVGIGVVPTVPFQLQGNVNGDLMAALVNTSTGTSCRQLFGFGSTSFASPSLTLLVDCVNYSNSGLYNAGSAIWYYNSPATSHMVFQLQAGDWWVTTGSSPTGGVGKLGVATGGHVEIADLSAGGMVKSTTTTVDGFSVGQLAQAAAGTDYSAGTASIATGPLCNTTGTGALSACTVGPGVTASGTTFRLGSVASPSQSTIAEFANVPPSTAAAASMQGVYLWDLASITLTGSTHVTGNGLALASFAGPTITDASAVTVDAASTVLITGPPAASGSVTLLTPRSLWVAAGQTSLDGALAVNGVTVGSNQMFVAGHSTETDRDSASLFLGGGTTNSAGDYLHLWTSAPTIPTSTYARMTTERIDQITYNSGGTATMTGNLSSLYVQGKPLFGTGAFTISGAAQYVAEFGDGVMKIDGDSTFGYVNGPRVFQLPNNTSHAPAAGSPTMVVDVFITGVGEKFLYLYDH